MSGHRPCSSYENHYTVKFLIGITHQGSISFVSKAWGGRTSDMLRLLTYVQALFVLINNVIIKQVPSGQTLSDYCQILLLLHKKMQCNLKENLAAY